MLKEYGLCQYGYYYGYGQKIKCNNCIVVEKIINQIPQKDKILGFRALSYAEKQRICNLQHDNICRGEFDEISLNADSYQGIINKIFTCIRETLNNKKTSNSKQFSYSKCIVVPLFKYIKSEPNPTIAIKNLEINSFDIRYNCIYYQWIKGFYTRDEERTYLTEGEITIEIKELFTSKLNSPNINDYLKRYYREHKYIPFEKYIEKYKSNLIQNENNQIEFCDLDDIEDIKIQSFTLDLSMFDRMVMNNYLEYCSNNAIKIKREASFTRDREIISTESVDSHKGKFFILQGEDLLDNIKIITICVLFLEKYQEKIGKQYTRIIREYIDKIRTEYVKDTERPKIDIVIQHLKDNSENEFDALLDIKRVIKNWNDADIDWLKCLINNCCKETSLTKSLICVLNDMNNDF